jgi:hypothetical protein
MIDKLNDFLDDIIFAVCIKYFPTTFCVLIILMVLFICFLCGLEI